MDVRNQERYANATDVVPNLMPPREEARLPPGQTRVAMVIQRFRPDFGGQGIQMEQLCQALARRGIESTVLAATRGHPSSWEACDGYRIRRLRADLVPGSARNSHLWMPTFGARVLFALLGRPRPDVVHVHGLHDGLYGAFVFCRWSGVPLVLEMTLMGVDDPATALASRHVLYRARHGAYRGADAYVAMSRAFLSAYASAGMPSDRLHIIPQGVDTRRFRPLSSSERSRVRSELGCEPAAPVAVFVGSLIKRKGIDILLAAWAAVHERRPDARLVLVGRDAFEPASDERVFLDAQLSRLPPAARDAISRLGLRDDPERLLGAADVFAFPSRREGFGSVIIEAMACGVPSVVARLDGITDMIFSAPIESAREGPGDGVIVPQDNSRVLADALLDLFNHPEHAARIGAAGLERARTSFSLDEVVAPAYERLYAGLTERTPRR